MIFIGRHTTAYMQEVKGSMDAIVQIGKSQGWTRIEYQIELRNMLCGYRQELRAGNIGLNKLKRPWANRPGF